MTEKDKKAVVCRKMLRVEEEPKAISPYTPPNGTLQVVCEDEDHIYYCTKNHEGECEFPEANGP